MTEPAERWDYDWHSYRPDRPSDEIPVNVKRNLDALMARIRLGQVKPSTRPPEPEGRDGPI
jgi:hypothetical protein